MARRGGGGAGVDWFCPEAVRGQVASLGAGAAVTALDAPLTDSNSSQAFGAGAIVGLRAWHTVYPGAANLGALTAVWMVLPTGMAVPAVLTEANRKAAERYIWFIGQLYSTSYSTTVSFYKDFSIKTARRFNVADRLVCVLINEGTVAFAAAATQDLLVDAYVRED